MIRKFYDPAVNEPAAMPSIAELMAKSGVVNDTGDMVATPIQINPEQGPEPTPATEPTPAATATEASPAEEAKPDTPPQPEPTPVVTPQIEEPPAKAPTLQEVLKSQQPDIVLKELGYDDKAVSALNLIKDNPKMIAFLNHWAANGNTEEYLREANTDYEKMPAEEVMRHQLKQDYPKATPQQLDALYQKRVIEHYNLNSEDEAEVEMGKFLLSAEADRHRDVFTAKQKEFLLPAPPEPKMPEPDYQEEARKQEIEAYKSSVANHPTTKNIISNRAFVLGDGEEKFSFPVDPNDLLGVLNEAEKWESALFDVNGEGENKVRTPKVEHQLLIATVAKYGKSFMDEYAKHYKSLGGKSAIAPIENASKPDGATPSASESKPTSVAEAMAKQGQVNYGGYR